MCVCVSLSDRFLSVIQNAFQRPTHARVGCGALRRANVKLTRKFDKTSLAAVRQPSAQSGHGAVDWQRQLLLKLQRNTLRERLLPLADRLSRAVIGASRLLDNISSVYDHESATTLQWQCAPSVSQSGSESVQCVPAAATLSADSACSVVLLSSLENALTCGSYDRLGRQSADASWRVARWILERLTQRARG